MGVNRKRLTNQHCGCYLKISFITIVYWRFYCYEYSCVSPEEILCIMKADHMDFWEFFLLMKNFLKLSGCQERIQTYTRRWKMQAPTPAIRK